jgi:two-component system sensor histidine kinase/response regulator
MTFSIFPRLRPESSFSKHSISTSGKRSRSTIELLASRAVGKNNKVHSFLPYQLPCLLRGDPSRLRQILLNLIGNSIKFTENGEINLTVALEEESASDVLLLFEVSDTGIGISEETQQRLFQPFTQADSSTTRKFGGTGLGLAISAKIASQMNGKMSVRSHIGEGSTFSFTARFQKQSKCTLALKTEALKGIRALVVDDNATDRKILHHYIISWGMRNGSVVSGPEALEMLRNAALKNDPYQIALLDSQAVGSGLKLALEIKVDPLLAFIHTVLMTPLGARFSKDELRQAKIERCIQKPLRQSELYNVIAAILFQDETPRHEKAADLVESSKTAKPLRILVAEDNVVNQKVALRQLQKLGHYADAVSNGHEVLEALDRIGYDVVLMDCHMPELDGYETTHAIRQHPVFHQTRIIAMTASAMQGDREKCLAAGMDDYLAKPVRLADLSSILQRFPTDAQSPATVAPASPKTPLTPVSCSL